MGQSNRSFRVKQSFLWGKAIVPLGRPKGRVVLRGQIGVTEEIMCGLWAAQQLNLHIARLPLIKERGRFDCRGEPPFLTLFQGLGEILSSLSLTQEEPPGEAAVPHRCPCDKNTDGGERSATPGRRYICATPRASTEREFLRHKIYKIYRIEDFANVRILISSISQSCKILCLKNSLAREARSLRFA